MTTGVPVNGTTWHPWSEAYVYATGRIGDGRRPHGVQKRIRFTPGNGTIACVMRYPVERFGATPVIGGFSITLPQRPSPNPGGSIG